MNNPAHPIYGLARFAVMCALLAFAMWLFATKFDETEAKAMGALGVERLAGIREKLTGGGR